MEIFRKYKSTFTVSLFCMAVVLGVSACSKSDNAMDQLVPTEAKPVGKRVYGPIDPVVIELPKAVVEALGGSDVYGKPLKEAFVYFRSFNLVVYRESFDVKAYIDGIAAAFAQIAADEAFAKAADIWAIQMQKRGTANFVNMAVAPAQVKGYLKHRNMSRFLKEADYLMISDHIIPVGERMNYYLGKTAAPAPQAFSPNP